MTNFQSHWQFPGLQCPTLCYPICNDHYQWVKFSSAGLITLYKLRRSNPEFLGNRSSLKIRETIIRVGQLTITAHYLPIHYHCIIIHSFHASLHPATHHALLFSRCVRIHSLCLHVHNFCLLPVRVLQSKALGRELHEIFEVSIFNILTLVIH